MNGVTGAGVAAGFFAVLSVLPAIAADKAFQRDDLADIAIRLEAQIKKDPGTVAKPASTLRSEKHTSEPNSHLNPPTPLLLTNNTQSLSTTPLTLHSLN